MKMVKKSLARQLTATIVALVAGTVLLCWFLNNTFLEGYYTYNKQEVMLDGFAIISVICADGSVIRASVNDVDLLRNTFMKVLFGKPAEIVEKTDSYVLERQVDSRLESEYLVLWGTLSDGNLIFMRTALESIRENAWISNRFLGYIGVLAVTLSAIISVFVSRKIANPILELTDISKRMAELDFNAKYSRKGETEIDQLGEHINFLSETLEKTISELKSANNELQIDIEKKIQIDQMRKEFLSNVSHELKTPLALIQG